MGPAAILALIAQGAQLVQTLLAESRAATQEEIDALWAAADAADAKAVAADDAAQKAAQQSGG